MLVCADVCVCVCVGWGVHHMALASPRDRLSLGDRGRERTSGNDVLTGEGG